ncbi:MAG: hypothetical protein KAR79_06095 [Simkaniaceae bacterium]|nr:hypothetical protein [Simkaniaceae bacterium]
MYQKQLDNALSIAAKQVIQDEPLEQKNFSSADAKALYSLAYRLYDIGDYKQSKKIFKELVVSKPLEQKHWFGLASILQLENTYHEALVSWSMAALLNDLDPQPHFHAAECLLSLEQIDEAFKALSMAKVRAKNHLDILEKIELLESSWNNKCEAPNVNS